MPSIAEAHYSAPLCPSSPITIKRKRDQFHNSTQQSHVEKERERDIHMIFSGRYSGNLSTEGMTGTTTELRYDITTPYLTSNSLHPGTTTTSHHHERFLLKPRSMKSVRGHDAKRQRVVMEDVPKNAAIPPSTWQDINQKASNDLEKSTAKQDVKKAVLSPCHICHRKPSVRSDLDGYVDCEGCGGRTCWICVRECLGEGDEEGVDEMVGEGMDGAVEEGKWEGRENGREDREWGHRSVVCSRCCVERGVDGDVRCFGCLRAEGG